MTTLFRTNRLRGVGAHILRVVPLLFSAALALLLLPACENDNKNNSPINTGDDETTITFSVSVPKEFSPSTYALSNDDESKLNTVDVMIFQSGNYLSGPHYGIINAEDEEVTVRIPEISGNYDMVVLANSRSLFNGLTFSASDSKETTLAKIVVAKDKWGATDGSGNIPMWGENVISGTPGSVTVSLIRMLARINVANNADNFTLTSVRVYNYNKNGRVSPKSGDTNIWNSAEKVAKLPSLPDTPDKETSTDKPLVYNIPADEGAKSGSTAYEYNNEIYTFEADVKSGTLTDTTRPFVIIGGKYDGSSTETFYRIDFYGEDAESNLTYFDLLRNSSYNIAISTITGNGLSLEQAITSQSINMGYEVLIWNGSSVTQVVSGGDAIGVSQGEFRFADNAVRDHTSSDNILVITAGNTWKLDKIVDDSDAAISWLSLVNQLGQPIAIGSTNHTSAVKLKLLAVGSGTTRTGYIHLASGSIELVVKVIQGEGANPGGVSLSITSGVLGDGTNKSLLRFVSPYTGSNIAASTIQPKTFTLGWSPSSAEVFYGSDVNVSTPMFEFATAPNAIGLVGKVEGANGTAQISIRPKTDIPASTQIAIGGSNPLDVYQSTIDYMIVDGSNSASHKLTLKHQIWDLLVLNSTGILEIDELSVSAPVSAEISNPIKLSYPAGAEVSATENSNNITVTGSYDIKVSGLTVSPSNPSKTISENIKFKATYEGESIEKPLTFSQEVWDSFITSSTDVTTEITELTLPAVPAGVAPTAQPFKLSYPESPTTVDVTASGDISGVGGSGNARTVTTKTVSAATAGLSKTEPLKTMSYSNAVTVKTTYNGNDVTKQLTIKQPIWDFFIVSGQNTSGSAVSSLPVFKDSGGSPAAKQYITLSFPSGSANSPNSVSLTSDATAGQYFTLTETGSTATTKTYSIQPKSALTKGAASITGVYTASVTYDGKTATSKTLSVTQESEPAIELNQVTPAIVYPMDGGTYPVTLNATPNATLYVSTNDTGSSAITNLTNLQVTTNSSGVATVNITTKNNIGTYPNASTLPQKDVTLTVSATSGGAVLANGTVTLNCITPEHESNSYIVNPSTTDNNRSILIPVSRANAVTDPAILGPQLGSSDAFTAGLVWTDNITGIDGNGFGSNLNSISTIGTGSSGYVLVETGNAQGNAVVAIKKDGVILWSWHIWVTTYVPSDAGNGLMDRNLGALDNGLDANGDIALTDDTVGLLYQWGRKDPFPGTKDITTVSAGGSGAERPIYYGTAATPRGTLSSLPGTIAQIAVSSTSDARPISDSVRNPDVFIKRSSNADWSSQLTGSGSARWNGTGNSKTVYDPCPPGWRVPIDGTWTGSAGNDGWQVSTFVTTHRIQRNDTQGGVYPAAGSRDRTYGSLLSVASDGYYWSASPYGANSGYSLSFSSSFVGPSSTIGRSYGYSVRCVQEPK